MNTIQLPMDNSGTLSINEEQISFCARYKCNYCSCIGLQLPIIALEFEVILNVVSCQIRDNCTGYLSRFLPLQRHFAKTTEVSVLPQPSFGTRCLAS